MSGIMQMHDVAAVPGGYRRAREGCAVLEGVMKSMRLLLFLALLWPLPAAAGPIFEIVGLGSAGYAQSSHWGIGGSGGGQMVGRLTLRDGLVLPTGSGPGVVLNKADVVELFYGHIDPNPGDGQPVVPILSFTVGPAEILSVSGTIGVSGSSTTIFGLFIETTFVSTQPSPIGIVTGSINIVDTAFELVDTVPPTTGTVRLIANSTQPSVWRPASTSIAEPASLTLLGLPAALALALRRRLSRREVPPRA